MEKDDTVRPVEKEKETDIDRKLAEEVQKCFSTLLSRQEYLPPEMEEILYSNLDDLYL